MYSIVCTVLYCTVMCCTLLYCTVLLGQVDSWTVAGSGCQCPFDPQDFTCACCAKVNKIL